MRARLPHMLPRAGVSIGEMTHERGNVKHAGVTKKGKETK
jgi:hypothetical protein